MMTNPAEIMESLKKEQLNPMPTSSVNFLEALPDVVFYAVMEKLPGRVIENTVRQLSRDCYRRVELRRTRLPRVYFGELHVTENEFFYSFNIGAGNPYRETIDSTNLMQHLEYLGERATFKIFSLLDVNWEMFANCKFGCEVLRCYVDETTLSPERFMDIFRGIRPTRLLIIHASGDNKIFPVTSDFFTNNYAVGLREVQLHAYGNAMVDPLNDTILLDLLPLSFYGYFQRYGSTLNGIQTIIRSWYTSERQIDGMDLRAVGGKAERQNFLRSSPELQDVKLIRDEGDFAIFHLKRANWDIVEIEVYENDEASIAICITRLVLDPEAGLYRPYNDIRYWQH